MNGSTAKVQAFVSGVEDSVAADTQIAAHSTLLVCPPALYIEAVHTQGHVLQAGAQDCAEADSGAYTGQLSAQMLKDAGCGYVIVGHSERREYQHESDAQVKAKAEQVIVHGLVAIICVGETEQEREQGVQENIVASQLRGSLPKNSSADNVVIAYEPVWAIGTGKTASPDDVAEMHDFIRGALQGLAEDADDVRILYGGSMKPDNAAALLSTSNVDGGLIGGASLEVESFINIAKAAF